MADFGVTEGLLLFGTLAGAASSYSTAQQQNAANRRAADAAAANAKASTEQLVDQTAAERRKNILESQRLTGKLRAAASESGGIGGSFEALLQQNALDTLANDQIIEKNYKAQGERIRSGLNANLADISGRNRNTIFDTYFGAASGAGSGLQLGGAYDSLTTRRETKINPPSGRAG